MKNSFKKTSQEFEVLEIENKKTFIIKKDEQKITFYDERLIEELINNKFNQKYKKLLYIIMDIITSDDATETDAEIIREQIDELRNKVLNKYGRYISKELLNKYLKMLHILDSKLVVPERHRGR